MHILSILTVEDYNAPSDSNDFEHTYVYDIVGNRLQKIADGNTTTYSYDSLADELISEHRPDVNIFYDYDGNGSLVAEYNDISPVRGYSYNLRGRLSSVTASGVTVHYAYDADGFRVAADNGQRAEQYLVDPFNHTGYSQVLKQTTEDGGQTTETRFYVIGSDVISQANDAQSPEYFLYDGHGSVRHLANSSGAVTESYSYDAYGDARGFSPASAATSLLYCGEMYDQHRAQYYLRARWYNPSSGRFNRLDPFGGNNQDPQSLHKYLYCQANPVNGIDPTGEDGEFSLVATMFVMAIILILICTPDVANAPGPDDVTFSDDGGLIVDSFIMMGGAVIFRVVLAPVVRSSCKYIGRALRPIAGRFRKGPGKWFKIKEGMSPRAARYQTQITGQPVQEAYIVDGIKFDGFQGGKLLEAKGPGYSNFVKEGRFSDWWCQGKEQLMKQAEHQVAVSQGMTVEWHFAEKEALDATRNLLGAGNKGIRLIHTPPK